MNALKKDHRHLHPANKAWLRRDPDTFGRWSEQFARLFGTTKYLAWQTLIVIAWIAVNLVAVKMRWDPYPFILLNLVFSTQAAYAAPLILLAQNRQETRDRASASREVERAEVDYAHNLESLAIGRLLCRELGIRDHEVQGEIAGMLAGEDHAERLQDIAANVVPTIVGNEPTGGG